MSNLVNVSELKTKEDWLAFEASILTVGLFTRLPLTLVNEESLDHSMALLWRGVLDQATFDLLRGPLVDARPPPKRNPGKPSKVYLKKMDKWLNVIVKEANRTHRDAIHWLYGGKTIIEWLDNESTVVEDSSDFIQVCELAHIEPDLAKETIVKLMKYKEKVLYDNESRD